MVWSVEWDGSFVVGGDPSRRLTPNFRLKEFQRSNGSVRVHRELVSALQMLRDRYARSMSVRSVDEDGLGATISGESVPQLRQTADHVKTNHHLFDQVEERQGDVHVRIPDPAALPQIELEQALETAFSVTAGFETAGDMFQQITGNFDAAGLSFGPAQVNFKSGTLVPLFRQFQQVDDAKLRACFQDPDDYQEWLRVMDLPLAKQLEWATSITTGRGGHDVVEPWRGYFRAVGKVQVFRETMVETILRNYGARMLKAVAFLQSLKPGIQIDHLRCVCSLYDLVIQQGSLDKARQAIEERVRRDDPKDQFELVRIAVEERGRKASPEWQDDSISRRMGILLGTPETVGDRQRANIRFYMLRDVRVRGARELMTADVTSQLAKASQAVASGTTLLA